MTREEYNKLIAKKCGFEELIGMNLDDAIKVLKKNNKTYTTVAWNPKETYIEDGIYVENQVNMVIKDGKVWAIYSSYEI